MSSSLVIDPSYYLEVLSGSLFLFLSSSSPFLSFLYLSLFLAYEINKISRFQESEIYQKCVRPPPNRTVFDSESPPPPYRSHSGPLSETSVERLTRSNSAGSSLLNLFRKFPPSSGSSTSASVVVPTRRPVMSNYSESSSNLSNLSSSNLSNLTVVPCETDESRQEQQQQQTWPSQYQQQQQPSQHQQPNV